MDKCNCPICERERRGWVEAIDAVFHDNGQSKYVPRKMYEDTQAESDRRLKLLIEARYFLEFVPIGMNDEDVKKFLEFMDELAKELGK